MKVSLQKQLRGGKNFFQLDVPFEIPSGEMLAVMGPSGAGKTTLLKMIAGLVAPDRGSIEINGQLWYQSQKRINLRTQDRSIGYVFQDYALFPNMSVRKNLEYALAAGQSREIIDEVLDLIHIQNLANQKPTALSGGQQQRVALARAIIRRPKVLLLDEPFAALDEIMRSKLQDDLMELHQRYRTTTLLVSHNPTEVARMASQVLMLRDGQIVHQGRPASVLASSGDVLLKGEVLAIDQDRVTVVIKNSLSTLVISNATSRYKVGDTLSINSEDYQIESKKVERNTDNSY
ncbi:MAG: ATP-binding cassette domain-containing protein [Bacteroidota bacterium]